MAAEIEKLHFLIVEDHPFQLQMLEQVLRSLGGVNIRTAANGAAAIRVLREPGATIDIVISDVMMPEVDGIELIPLLAKFAPGASLLLLSGEGWPLDVGSALAHGHGIPLLGVLLKPLTPDKLRPLLEAHMAGRSKRPDIL